jgi:hypothetical protein
MLLQRASPKPYGRGQQIQRSTNRLKKFSLLGRNGSYLNMIKDIFMPKPTGANKRRGKSAACIALS